MAEIRLMAGLIPPIKTKFGRFGNISANFGSSSFDGSKIMVEFDLRVFDRF
jgi:hypothetical protein